MLFTTDPALNREHLQQAVHTLGSREIAIPREILNAQDFPLLGTGKVNYDRLTEDAGRVPAATSGAG